MLHLKIWWKGTWNLFRICPFPTLAFPGFPRLGRRPESWGRQSNSTICFLKMHVPGDSPSWIRQCLILSFQITLNQSLLLRRQNPTGVLLIRVPLCQISPFSCSFRQRILSNIRLAPPPLKSTSGWFRISQTGTPAPETRVKSYYLARLKVQAYLSWYWIRHEAIEIMVEYLIQHENISSSSIFRWKLRGGGTTRNTCLIPHGPFFIFVQFSEKNFAK